MQNVCGKIRELMKIFHQHFKMNSAVKKFKIMEINGYSMFANGQTATLDTFTTPPVTRHTCCCLPVPYHCSSFDLHHSNLVTKNSWNLAASEHLLERPYKNAHVIRICSFRCFASPSMCPSVLAPTTLVPPSLCSLNLEFLYHWKLPSLFPPVLEPFHPCALLPCVPHHHVLYARPPQNKTHLCCHCSYPLPDSTV